MKVTQVALRPTEASNAVGRPALTPELLAASGARYSRSNDGLEAIIEKIDPANLDRSVDSIFRMIDYGHQSIADMAPVAMFIDGLSLWLAYHIWSLCPTAGGQESSTRYIRFDEDRLISAEQLGVPSTLIPEWSGLMADCFQAFKRSLTFWERLVETDPEIARIPRSLLDAQSDKAGRQVARMRRNFGFDRARYLLPCALATNMMLVMSARAWVQLCQYLRSSSLLEARTVGAAIASELELAAPRMLKHAVEKQGFVNGIAREFQTLSRMAERASAPYLAETGEIGPHPSEPYLEVMAGSAVDGAGFASDLEFHDNRYGWFGEGLRRTAVRFGWSAVAFAEIRDLNRHRTGSKYCPPLPLGFYDASDQLPETIAGGVSGDGFSEGGAVLRECAAVGRRAAGRARSLLREGETAYIYWTTLGTQYAFEHVTTADKFLYEAELRTGAGAHYRYAEHLRDSLGLWYARFPETRGLVIEGSAEPE